MILIFAGLVVPFAILQSQINTTNGEMTNDVYRQIATSNLFLAPVRNALISGIIFPLLATIALGLQQYFYLKNLKTKMEYPVPKKLIKSYGAIGVAGAGLIILAIVFFVTAFCVGNRWDPKKYLYIAGIVVTGIYGAGIYLWAVIVNMHIIYDQARQQAKYDEAVNDKNPPLTSDTNPSSDSDLASEDHEVEQQVSSNSSDLPSMNNGDSSLASSGNF